MILSPNVDVVDAAAFDDVPRCTFDGTPAAWRGRHVCCRAAVLYCAGCVDRMREDVAGGLVRLVVCAYCRHRFHNPVALGEFVTLRGLS
jgi:hypothetical protein